MSPHLGTRIGRGGRMRHSRGPSRDGTRLWRRRAPHTNPLRDPRVVAREQQVVCHRSAPATRVLQSVPQAPVHGARTGARGFVRPSRTDGLARVARASVTSDEVEFKSSPVGGRVRHAPNPTPTLCLAHGPCKAHFLDHWRQSSKIVLHSQPTAGSALY